MPFLLATQLLLMFIFNPLNLGSELILKVISLLLPAPLGLIGGLLQLLALTRQLFILGL
jgi:hypothetical protein